MSNLLHQAVTHHQAGNLSEAERLYRAVLSSQPHQPDAMALLGVVCGAKGSHEEAIGLVEKAVAKDPKSALFKFHLGSVLMNAKKLPEAILAFRQAIVLQPGMAQAHYNMANALRASGDWESAVAAYRQAIKHNASYPEAWNNLALSLVHEQKYDEALAAAHKSVEIAPLYGEGWRTICNVAEQMKDFPLALSAGEHCIKLMPESHFAWFGYGVALNRLERHEDALDAYKRALALKPERADIWDNLGQTYQSLNRLDEAEATFRKTLEVAGQLIEGEGSREVAEEEYGNRHWHLALMELLRGNYKSGFARYRARFKDVGGLQRPSFSRPLWKKEDIKGKTVLVCDEQGFGDTLMLVRYLPLMKAAGARIILSVHKVLEPLFQGWSGADEIVTHGTGVAPYDFYVSVFDLPHNFGTTLETIPVHMPYLPLLDHDEALSLVGDGRPKVGVVWGGSPLHKNDDKRSIPLKVFGKIFSDPNVQFFSLNRDMKGGDATLLPQYPVTDLAPRIKTFADSSRLIGQLDLVITCDTATAHLAGGMGKKVWTVLPFAPDWRWMTEREDSPWYPSMRLFRQPKPGDWAGAIEEVQKALLGGRDYF